MTSVSTVRSCCGIALDRRDQVGDQVGAALIFALQIAPVGVDLLLGGRDAVEPAAGEAEGGERSKQSKTAKCGHVQSPLIERARELESARLFNKLF